MKKALIAIAALLVSVSAYAQGQVVFRTHVASDVPPIDYKILNADGSVATSGFAELFAVNGSTFTPMDGAPASINAAGYVNAGTVTFGTLAPGSTANLVLRAWQGAAGSTYDSATIRGQSPSFSTTFAVPPNPPGDLLTLGTGTLSMVPEPTTLALGAVGLGALLLRRRRA